MGPESTVAIKSYIIAYDIHTKASDIPREPHRHPAEHKETITGCTKPG